MASFECVTCGSPTTVTYIERHGMRAGTRAQRPPIPQAGLCTNLECVRSIPGRQTLGWARQVD